MAITLPIGIRVTAGLLGTAIDRLSSLPRELPGLGITVAGQVLRTSMRVRQEIAELATRGDDLLAGLTGGSQENPAWATFDEDEDQDEPALSHPAGRPGARQHFATDVTDAAPTASAVREPVGGRARTRTQPADPDVVEAGGEVEVEGAGGESDVVEAGGESEVGKSDVMEASGESEAGMLPLAAEPTVPRAQQAAQQSPVQPDTERPTIVQATTRRARGASKPGSGRPVAAEQSETPAQVGQTAAETAKRRRSRLPVDHPRSDPSPASDTESAPRITRNPRIPRASQPTPSSANTAPNTLADARSARRSGARPPGRRGPNSPPADPDNGEAPAMEAKPSRKSLGPNRVSLVQDRVDAPGAPVTRPSATRSRAARVVPERDIPHQDIPPGKSPVAGRAYLTGVPTRVDAGDLIPSTDLPVTGPHPNGAAATSLIDTGLPATGSEDNIGLSNNIGPSNNKGPTNNTSPTNTPATVDITLEDVLAESAFIPGAPIPADHSFSLAELKERLQDRDSDAVRTLLDQEQSGPNRAAYLTLLGNRLTTLEHRDS